MGLNKFNNVKVSGILTVVPSNFLNIDDEIRFYKNDSKILERNKKILGVGKRHIVKDGMTCLDLFKEAADRLIEKMSINKKEIDTIIVVSASHDYNAPATACLLQDYLGLEEFCNCFDTHGLSCSGYIYGLWLAHSLISSGASKKCLLMTGDTNSMHSNIQNRISHMLYGDAASATLLEYNEEENTAYFNLGTRGKDWDKIIAPATGHKFPVREDIASIEITDEAGNVWHLWEDILKGMDIFKFTMECAPKSIKEIKEYANISNEDIDFFPIHQANGQIVRTIAQHAEIPKDKISSETFSKYANCGAASIVTNICDQLNNKKLNNVLLSTFGTGLSWGAAILNFKNINIYDIEKFQPNEKFETREELIEHWIKHFKGEPTNAS